MKKKKSKSLEQVLEIDRRTNIAFLRPHQRKNQRIMARFKNSLESAGIAASPVVLCSGNIRMHLRQLLERFMPNVAIISHSEIPPSVRVMSVGMVA